MNFDELLAHVGHLNQELAAVTYTLEFDSRRRIHAELWAIVEELNERLGLQLANTALDLRADGKRLVIHYWFGEQSPHNSHEVKIYIDENLGVERCTTDLRTGVIDARCSGTHVNDVGKIYRSLEGRMNILKCSEGRPEVELFWSYLNEHYGCGVGQEFWDIVKQLPQNDIPAAVIKLAARKGFLFSSDDYRRAVIKRIKRIESEFKDCHDLMEEYMRLVEAGRWFEVVDGVVFGG